MQKKREKKKSYWFKRYNLSLGKRIKNSHPNVPVLHSAKYTVRKKKMALT